MLLSLPIFGPFSVHIYGFFIMIGVTVLLYALAHDKPRKKVLSLDSLYMLATYSIIGGVVGGKLLYLIEFLHQEGAVWSDSLPFSAGGFSILGTIIGVGTTLIGYLYYHRLPLLLITDRIALYAPLTQAIARLGCFFAGCCAGVNTDSFLGVVYTNAESLAPLYCSIHPTQLYSSAFLLMIFIFSFMLDKKHFKKPGQLTAYYLILVSLERFTIDFLRDDRVVIINNFSIMQLVALGLGTLGFLLMAASSNNNLSSDSFSTKKS